jgi:hypothetical protein
MDLANASNEALLLLAQHVFPDVEVEKAKTANAGAEGKENKSPSTPLLKSTESHRRGT